MTQRTAEKKIDSEELGLRERKRQIRVFTLLAFFRPIKIYLSALHIIHFVLMLTVQHFYTGSTQVWKKEHELHLLLYRVLRPCGCGCGCARDASGASPGISFSSLH